MEDFKWHFGNFTSEMENTAYRYFIKTDRDYQEAEYYINRHKDKFDSILDKLSEEDKRFVMHYIDRQTFRASSSSNELYISGYKDCAKLLRELGII